VKTASCAIKHNSHSRNFAFRLDIFQFPLALDALQVEWERVVYVLLSCPLLNHVAGEAIIFCVSPGVSKTDSALLKKVQVRLGCRRCVECVAII